MRLKKNFRIFEEPYSVPVRYWLADIFNGDIYEIDKEVFNTVKTNGSSKKVIKLLVKIGAV